MIGKIIAFWKIKSGLKKKLSIQYGKRKRYSVEEILEGCRDEHINEEFIMYAVAAYSTASEFYTFLKKNGLSSRHKYKILRSEMGLEKIDVDDDYSNPTGAAPM